MKSQHWFIFPLLCVRMRTSFFCTKEIPTKFVHAGFSARVNIHQLSPINYSSYKKTGSVRFVLSNELLNSKLRVGGIQAWVFYVLCCGLYGPISALTPQVFSVPVCPNAGLYLSRIFFDCSFSCCRSFQDIPTDISLEHQICGMSESDKSSMDVLTKCMIAHDSSLLHERCLFRKKYSKLLRECKLQRSSCVNSSEYLPWEVFIPRGVARGYCPDVVVRWKLPGGPEVHIWMLSNRIFLKNLIFFMSQKLRKLLLKEKGSKRKRAGRAKGSAWSLPNPPGSYWPIWGPSPASMLG